MDIGHNPSPSRHGIDQNCRYKKVRFRFRKIILFEINFISSPIDRTEQDKNIDPETTIKKFVLSMEDDR